MDVPILDDWLCSQLKAKSESIDARLPRYVPPPPEVENVLYSFRRENRIPVSYEVEILKSHSTQLDNASAAIACDIAALQLKLNEIITEMVSLQRQRTAMEEESKLFSASKSSIRLFSPEILAEIFSYSAADGRTKLTGSSLLALAHLDRLADWQFSKPLFQGLHPFLNRITTLRLDSYSIRDLTLLSALDELPSLNTLTLSIRTSDWADDELLNKLDLLGVESPHPSLRSAWQNGDGDTLFSPFLGLPWEHLTRVYIESRISFAAWANLMLDLVSLEWGSFLVRKDYVAGDVSPHTRPQPITLHHLSTLIISLISLLALSDDYGFDGWDPIFFDPQVEMPALHTVIFSGINLPRHIPDRSLITCLVLNQVDDLDGLDAFLAGLIMLEKLAIDMRSSNFDGFSNLPKALAPLCHLSALAVAIYVKEEKLSEMGEVFSHLLQTVAGRSSSAFKELHMYGALYDGEQQVLQRFWQDLDNRVSGWAYDKIKCPSGFLFTKGDIYGCFDISKAVEWHERWD
ncbi:hypothetical protein H0H81_004765 [Sphagnurus paluster]|uniref:Uncharacterized protein n=1 Tax=Sphagnurus paluster TaxID=117069 RepID=A0A9P7FSM4_9AGAR|nr:hypothetical protein H0H81_004765 [Sphagnurus paluster]